MLHSIDQLLYFTRRSKNDESGQDSKLKDAERCHTAKRSVCLWKHKHSKKTQNVKMRCRMLYLYVGSKWHRSGWSLLARHLGVSNNDILGNGDDVALVSYCIHP